MELVAPRFREKIDYCAARPAHFRAVAVGIDPDFLDHVNRGAHQDGELFALVVVHPVDHLVVEYFVLAVGADVGGLAALVGTRAAQNRVGRPNGHAYGALHQRDIIAAVQRQILHGLRTDKSRQRRTVGLQGGALHLDLHRLGHFSYLQLHIRAGAIAGRDRQIHRGFLEARRLHRDRVLPRLHQIENIVARCV